MGFRLGIFCGGCCVFSCEKKKWQRKEGVNQATVLVDMGETKKRRKQGGAVVCTCRQQEVVGLA